MKLITALLLLFGYTGVAISKFTPEHMALVTKVLNECKVENNTSDDVVAKFLRKDLVPEIKCFAACIMSKLGIMNADNTLNKDVAMADVNEFFDNDKKLIKKWEGIYDICSTETDSDKCEAIYKIYECFEKERKEQGIEIPF